MESVYQEVAVSEETGRVKEVKEVKEEAEKEEKKEVKEEVKKEEEAPQKLVIREFDDSILPFLPLKMTLLGRKPVSNHWVFEKWQCDEDCRLYSTMVDGVEYNTTVHDVKRTITSPLRSSKTADSLTVVYGGKEYYIIPPGNSCRVLRKQIAKVYD